MGEEELLCIYFSNIYTPTENEFEQKTKIWSILKVFLLFHRNYALHEGLTHIHSQKKPRLHFGESFTLNTDRKSAL